MENETETRTSGLSKRVQAIYEWLEALGDSDYHRYADFHVPFCVSTR